MIDFSVYTPGMCKKVISSLEVFELENAEKESDGNKRSAKIASIKREYDALKQWEALWFRVYTLCNSDITVLSDEELKSGIIDMELLRAILKDDATISHLPALYPLPKFDPCVLFASLALTPAAVR